MKTDAVDWGKTGHHSAYLPLFALLPAHPGDLVDKAMKGPDGYGNATIALNKLVNL